MFFMSTSKKGSSALRLTPAVPAVTWLPALLASTASSLVDPSSSSISHSMSGAMTSDAAGKAPPSNLISKKSAFEPESSTLIVSVLRTVAAPQLAPSNRIASPERLTVDRPPSVRWIVAVSAETPQVFAACAAAGPINAAVAVTTSAAPRNLPPTIAPFGSQYLLKDEATEGGALLGTFLLLILRKNHRPVRFELPSRVVGDLPRDGGS